MSKILKIIGRQVFDSRGNPTVEAEAYSEKNSARAIVPSGASTGKHEALELRDKKKAYGGKGVSKAVANISKISRLVKGMDLYKQKELDFRILRADNTENKSKYGANAILASSMAMARLAAKDKKIDLYEYLNTMIKRPIIMPIPFMNIINGGLHADNPLDFQEYMLVPIGKSFSDSLRIGSEVYHELKDMLKKKRLSTAVGDEGGFAPELKNYEEPIRLILKAARNLGYENKVKLALDVAASDIYKKKSYVIDKKNYTADKLTDLYLDLKRRYPIISIEDPFHEEDFKSFAELTKLSRIQIVGDDLLVTNVKRMQTALKFHSCNALLLKLNQIGSLTEAIHAAELAYRNQWNVMVSHRSGETEDSFIADLAVAIGSGQIKTGAPCRGERTAKYNQLLRIEEKLGRKAIFQQKIY